MKAKAGKSIASIALLLAAAVMLSGCVHMTVNLKINGDGSADWGYDMLMQDSMLEMASLGMETAGEADMWDEATREAEAQGMAVERLPSADGYSGIRVTRHFENVAEMMDSDLLAGTDAMVGDAESYFNAKETKGFFATTYEVEMKTDVSEAMASAETGDETTDAMVKAMMDQVEMRFVVTMPVKASGHNATDVSADGLTYTWDIKLDTPNDMKVTASVPNMGNILLVAGGAALVLIIAAVIIILASVSAKKRKAAAAAQ